MKLYIGLHYYIKLSPLGCIQGPLYFAMIGFGSWGDRSGQDEENLSNNDKLLSMWETFIWSHMFKLSTLKRLTDDIKIVFHLCRGVDLMTEEVGLVRHNKEGKQVGDKMTEIGEYQKQGKIENMRKKKNVGGGAKWGVVIDEW